MRAPRSVTMQPTARPSRILNVATDFFDLRTAGFWPVMRARSDGRGVHDLLVGHSLADAHVHGDLA